jgi:hypothetical protein
VAVAHALLRARALAPPDHAPNPRSRRRSSPPLIGKLTEPVDECRSDGESR